MQLIGKVKLPNEKGKEQMGVATVLLKHQYRRDMMPRRLVTDLQLSGKANKQTSNRSKPKIDDETKQVGGSGTVSAAADAKK